MSPSAVTIGVDTESRSHPRRYDRTDRPTVTTRMKTEPSAPPTTEIVTRLQSEMDGSPNAEAATFASTASQSAEANVVTTAM